MEPELFASLVQVWCAETMTATMPENAIWAKSWVNVAEMVNVLGDYACDNTIWAKLLGKVADLLKILSFTEILQKIFNLKQNNIKLEYKIIFLFFLTKQNTQN